MKNKIIWIAAFCGALITVSSLYLLVSARKEISQLQGQLQEKHSTLETTLEALSDCTMQAQKICQAQEDKIAEANKSDIEKVLEPENTTPDHAAKVDQLKKRYEDLLVTYFVLRKCDKVKPVDYHIITSALSQEMASINAPGRLQYDILIAAKGSYQALYANNKCTEESTNALYTDYKRFIDTTTDQFNLR